MEWSRRAYCLMLLVPLALGACRDDTIGRRRLPGDVIVLAIKDQKLTTEVAFDDASRQAGLMHRDQLREDAGMLFIFPDPHPLGFWMKNTRIPLSIAFLDDKGKILQIEDMKPHDESRTRSVEKVRYALEVNQGWFGRHEIKVGDAFADFEERTRGFRVR